MKPIENLQFLDYEAQATSSGLTGYTVLAGKRVLLSHAQWCHSLSYTVAAAVQYRAYFQLSTGSDYFPMGSAVGANNNVLVSDVLNIQFNSAAGELNNPLGDSGSALLGVRIDTRNSPLKLYLYNTGNLVHQVSFRLFFVDL